MASDLIKVLDQVGRERGVEKETLIKTLEEAVRAAARKKLGPNYDLEINFNDEMGEIEIFEFKEVVQKVNNENLEISLEQASEIDPEVVIGDSLGIKMDMDDLGRVAAQSAKQVIIQRVREAEREKIFADYSDRVGELVTGTVQQIEKGNILVNLGRTEALLPYREQIRKEHYRQGDNIRACILEVKNNPKGPQVIVSRTCPEFLARLFELEVPEIFDKTVRIVKVVRDPGHRSKIAVTTNDSRVDPVGACVGMR